MKLVLINKNSKATKMTVKIIKAKDFKPQNVKFSEPRANKYGGKVVYVNYDFEDGGDPRPLRIQLDKMKAPFGVSGWDSNRGDNKTSDPTETSNDTLELSFNSSSSAIIEKFQQLDEFAVDAGVLNSKDFFKKKHSKDEVKLFYKSNLKFNENDEGDRDDKYPPRFKTKLLKDSSHAYLAQVYDDKKAKVHFDIYNHASVIPKGSDCVSIIECSGVWIIAGKFGLSWRPAQLKVYKNDLKLTECEFLDDDEEPEEVLEKTAEETDLFGETEEPEEIKDDIDAVAEDFQKTTIRKKKTAKI